MQVLIHVVSALFDINPSMSTHMLVHLWKKCVAVLLEVLDLLRAHPEVVLDEAHEVRRLFVARLAVEERTWVGERPSGCWLVACALHLILHFVCLSSHARRDLISVFAAASTLLPLLWCQSSGQRSSVLAMALEACPHMRQGGEERTEEPAAGEEVRVWGNLVANLERLDDEMFKSLQVIDPHTHKYLERMQDEPLFLALAQRVRSQFHCCAHAPVAWKSRRSCVPLCGMHKPSSCALANMGAAEFEPHVCISLCMHNSGMSHSHTVQ